MDTFEALVWLHAAPRLRFRLSEGWFREKGNGARSARLWARLLGVEQVVVDRDSGRVVWAAPGHDSVMLGRFFDALRLERCQHVRLGSADAAEWIARVVAARCLNAVLCADPFHVVCWATNALDKVRLEVWNAARKGGESAGR